MASKNPKTPTRAQAPKSPARPAAPRRRTTPKTIVPAELVTDERTATAVPAETAPPGSHEASTDATPHETSIDYAEHVRTRAYFLSLARKGRPGNAVDDWLAAERELGSGAQHDA